MTNPPPSAPCTRRTGRTARVVAASVAALLLVPGSLSGEAVAAPDTAPRAAKLTADCARPTSAFKPTSARIATVDRNLRMVTVRRTKSGAIGAPTTKAAGKFQLGWDPETRPGSGEGSVITVAHTWPDGSALGNALLRSTRKGATIVVSGKGGATACYRVTKRASYRAAQVPRKKAFRYWGPEQLVIVVCSGKRLGPGRWTHRTIWYATPVV
ncbi:class F sortase [Pimelobacter simplex]|uniref:Class F sortase n=1 Tax=Nocardioides simplex TaxID=2045 RepID=A0A7J5DSR9_NOCSI|nr:class F sortase [Pimelobacter simplex]KAB2807944.1 class F sortase [Pimelobacter simplex]